MGLLAWLADILRRRKATTERSAPAPDLVIPIEVRRRLIADNETDPLFPKLRRFGRGRPGVLREEEDWWVIRDDGGCVVGGARVGHVGPDHPPALDVAVDPRQLRRGFASALYQALEEAGIDVEAASMASLAHRTMTPLGYAFMLGRRLRVDRNAEAPIIATANVCPACGPLP